MNGKVLKVTEYNLTFGTPERKVNVLSLFRYKQNNNLYVIYTDPNTTYSFINYGGSHINDTTILSMTCSNKKEEEIIKEYVFKVTNKEELTDFEIVSLKDITEIEIIGSNKLELKKEVLTSLTELTLPKPQEKEVNEKENNTKKKKSKMPKILMFILLILLLAGGYYYYSQNLKTTSNNQNEINKTITCTKTYDHEDLENVVVDEEKIFNFNNNDSLENVNTNSTYNFQSDDDYFNFIQEGTYYKYMQQDKNIDGSYKNDDNKKTFKIMLKEKVGNNYSGPTAYEEVLSYYKNENYNCNEK